MDKECIILAGGFGTRLQPIVHDVPKCMAQVANQPFLSYIFNYLEKQNFTHIVLSLGYKADVIIEWLKEQQRSFKTSYVIENEPLGTGGAIKYAFSEIKSNKALVINGDTFFDINTDLIYAAHTKNMANISLALKHMVNFDRYGTVEIDDNNRIIAFGEKKAMVEGFINGGVYLIDKNIFSQLSLTNKFSFEKDILEKELSNLLIYGLSFDNYFIDIGIPTDYEKANIDFKDK